MKKAISIWAFEDNETRSAEDIFTQAKKAKFEGIELAVGEKGLLTPDTKKKDCEQLLEAAAEVGIEISGIASGLGWAHPMTAEEGKVRNEGKKVHRKMLQIGAWLDVDAVLVIPGRVYAGFVGDKGDDHVPYDVCWKRATSAIKSLVKTAQRHRVALAVENVWNMFLLSPLEMKDFIDQFKSKWVGCYFDTGNCIKDGFAEDWISILGKRIKRVHFKDYKRNWKSDAAKCEPLDGFCDILDGDCNYPAVMEQLKKAGYEGPCTVEEIEGRDLRWMRKISKRVDKIFDMA